MQVCHTKTTFLHDLPLFLCIVFKNFVRGHWYSYHLYMIACVFECCKVPDFTVSALYAIFTPFSPSGFFILNQNSRISWQNYSVVKSTTWRLLLSFKNHHFLCIAFLSQCSVILCCVTLFCSYTLIFTEEKIRKISRILEHKNAWDMKTKTSSSITIGKRTF